MTFRNFTAKLTSFLHQFLHSCFCRFFLKWLFIDDFGWRCVELFSIWCQKLLCFIKQWTLKVSASVRSADFRRVNWTDNSAQINKKIKHQTQFTRLNLFVRTCWTRKLAEHSKQLKVQSLLNAEKKLRRNSPDCCSWSNLLVPHPKFSNLSLRDLHGKSLHNFGSINRHYRKNTTKSRKTFAGKF